MSKRTVTVGTFRASPAMMKNVLDVLSSGRISYGPYSLEFEKRFAEIHGCQYAILSNSGTSSLQVALQTLKELHGWQDGDQVIVPATTFVATANIVLHNGLAPVFVDVDPLTYNLNPELIEPALTERTRAMIPVHLFGQAADMTRIMEIARAHDLKVIEDSCETMFAYHRYGPVGSWGDIACFSTYVAHLLVTGVGGLSTTNNPDYAGYMRSLVNHGLELENLNPGENFAPQPMPGRRFKFFTHGHSYRITELEAAIGLAQLESAERMIRIRFRNGRHLTAGLNNLINRIYGDPIQAATVAEGNTHSFMMYPIVLREKEKGPLVQYLNERGIETRDMLPILGQPCYDLDPGEFPVSAWLARSGFYVGCHQGLTPEDIQYVIDTLESFFTEELRANEDRSIALTHARAAA